MAVDDRLSHRVRAQCAEVVASAAHVWIDAERLGTVEPNAPPPPDPEEHLHDADREEVARFTLILDSINFGSGWFPTLRKRPGRSGSRTIAAAMTEHARRDGVMDAAALRALDPAQIAAILGQEPGHELMDLYAAALNDLGRFLGDRGALEVIALADGSAQRLAEMLAEGMAMFDDRGFYKRAQIVPSDLALAGVGDFDDLDELTIFADNLVPHVLRVDGVLRYDAALATMIDAEELLPPGGPEREIRAAALHACEQISQRSGIAPRALDMWLWNRGQQAEYKAIPRHRTRTVHY